MIRIFLAKNGWRLIKTEGLKTLSLNLTMWKHFMYKSPKTIDQALKITKSWKCNLNK